MALPEVELAEVQLLDAPFRVPTPGMLAASVADFLQQLAAPLLAALAAAHAALTAAPGSLPLAAAAAAAAGGVAAVVLVAAQGRLQQRQGPVAAIAAAMQQLAARLGGLTGAARAAVVPAPDAWIRHVSSVWAAADGTAEAQQAAAAAAAKKGRVWGLARPPSEAALRATRLLQELLELSDDCSSEEVVRLVKGLTSFDLEVDDKGHQLASVLHPDKMTRLLQALAWRWVAGQLQCKAWSSCQTPLFCARSPWPTLAFASKCCQVVRLGVVQLAAGGSKPQALHTGCIHEHVVCLPLIVCIMRDRQLHTGWCCAD
jgi:hypothetical protein